MSGTILITGATAGIGMAAARRFARAGLDDPLAAELGACVRTIVLDMRDTNAVEAAAAGAGAVDLLLNTAGLAPRSTRCRRRIGMGWRRRSPPISPAWSP